MESEKAVLEVSIAHGPWSMITTRRLMTVMIRTRQMKGKGFPDQMLDGAEGSLRERTDVSRHGLGVLFQQVNSV